MAHDDWGGGEVKRLGGVAGGRGLVRCDDRPPVLAGLVLASLGGEAGGRGQVRHDDRPLVVAGLALASLILRRWTRVGQAGAPGAAHQTRLRDNSQQSGAFH